MDYSMVTIPIVVTIKVVKMRLSEIKNHLADLNDVVFKLPNGEKVPSHFHVSEVGSVKKHFIDCGGTIRHENVINFQLWTSIDYDHRLAPQKLKSIIELSEKHLDLADGDIEVEYQGETSIQKYGLELIDGEFQLTSKFTACLAEDKCGVLQEKPKVRLSAVGQNAACAPGSGCC